MELVCVGEGKIASSNVMTLLMDWIDLCDSMMKFFSELSMINSSVSKLETFCCFNIVSKITPYDFKYSVKCLHKIIA